MPWLARMARNMALLRARRASARLRVGIFTAVMCECVRGGGGGFRPPKSANTAPLPEKVAALLHGVQRAEVLLL